MTNLHSHVWATADLAAILRAQIIAIESTLRVTEPATPHAAAYRQGFRAGAATLAASMSEALHVEVGQARALQMLLRGPP